MDRCLPLAALSLALVAPHAAQQARPAKPGGSSALGSCFDSSGGPNGDFDWVVPAGQFFFFDTTSTVVTGGPGGVPTSSQVCLNGRIDVRNLIIEPGGEIRVQGPNPMRIQATGDVVVRGILDVSGLSGRDVATLNTGNQVELGGAGVGGGGQGGLGNPVTTDSSPAGGTGNGPFGLAGAGGQGGESGYYPGANKDSRRPGGGGGGRFARDLPTSPVQPVTLASAATAGNDGNENSTGALSGLQPSAGGAAGAGPFADGKRADDFWGDRPVRGPGGIVTMLRGELPRLWAGYGGGGGGNAMHSDQFPTPNWNFGSDEKGGPGGGGGGGLHVQALGSIVFGNEGQILSNGGRGGTGENTNFLDHIGGTGGGGSGGHVVLESATRIDFTDGGLNTNALPRAWILALGPVKKTGPTADVNVCCRTNSNGGAGGPGVIQLHVPDPLSPPGTNPALTDILVPAAIANLRYPLTYVAAPSPFVVFPTCDPFPPAPFSWFGGAGRRILERALLLGVLPAEDPSGAGSGEPEPFVLPLLIPRW